MRYWIDFKKLREELSFGRVLEHFNVTLREKGEQWTGPCPLPDHQGERKTDSFSANVAKGIFQCFSCHAKGNVLDFAVLMSKRDPKNGHDLRQTAIELAKAFQLQHVGSEQKSRQQPRAPKPVETPKPSVNGEVPRTGRLVVNGPLGFELKNLDPNHPYLESRGFDAATIKRFGLGFCTNGRLAGRIAIPIHDREGQLIAYAGRLVEDESITAENPKYLFPGSRVQGETTYEFRKSLIVYNAHRVVAPVKCLTIVEGFASVWWLTQLGFPNCVAIMGSTLSSEQAKVIQGLVETHGTIIALLDADAPGFRGRNEICAKLAGAITIEQPTIPLGAQPTDLSAEQIAALMPAEKPVEVIGFAREERICELIAEFPCLAPLRLTAAEWDAERFDEISLGFRDCEREAARFILTVWDSYKAWKTGPFCIVKAASLLDEANRKPILEWFEKPMLP